MPALGQWARGALSVAAIAVAACGGDSLLGSGGGGGGGSEPSNNLRVSCNLPQDQLFDGGVARDAIPALVNPELVNRGDEGTEYLSAYAAFSRGIPELPDVRVVGLVVGDQAVAVPHNILWWHEIVHFDLGGQRLAVTYCPLTGSALVFSASEARTNRFGVSGLLFQNNLVMFDPETQSLWPQMLREARCGPRSGTQLVEVPNIEMNWESWKTLHPATLVVSSSTGWDRNYAQYPYDLYESADFLLFPMDGIDGRRAMKERVLGVPEGSGGVAFPFGELESQGTLAAVSAVVGAREIVVLWDGGARAARAYEPRTDGGPATLEVDGTRLVDRETGSVWTVEGVAVEGERAGKRLVAITDGFVAFWFAWAAFQPETVIWTP